MSKIGSFLKKLKLLWVVPFATLMCCQQPDFISDSSIALRFSTDTLSFDTIFSPIGSTTFTCKVYNPSNTNLMIDEVKLVQLNSSPFLMNVDGSAGYVVRNIRLAKKDSMYIFIEVVKNRMLLLSDEIVFTIGGIEQTKKLQLMAYGQDAIVVSKDTLIKSNTSLTADKPYIFMGNIVVDTAVTLNLNAGAKLYFDRQRGIVVNGTLNVNGTLTNPCVLSHPRYNDPWYATAPGQWQGVRVNAIGQVNVEYARMLGARFGFEVIDTLNTSATTQLTLSKSLVQYSEAGIWCRNGDIIMDNTLVANSLTNAVLVEGGKIQSYLCTFATYDKTSQSAHGSQVLLQNFHTRKDYPLLQADFGSCIIYGNNANELSIKKSSSASVPLNYKFDYGIIKVDNSFSLSDASKFIKISKQDPKFKSIINDNFHLDKNSPAINTGKQSTISLYPIDAEGYNRTVLQDSSLGCYVYHP